MFEKTPLRQQLLDRFPTGMLREELLGGLPYEVLGALQTIENAVTNEIAEEATSFALDYLKTSFLSKDMKSRAEIAVDGAITRFYSRQYLSQKPN